MVSSIVTRVRKKDQVKMVEEKEGNELMVKELELKLESLEKLRNELELKVEKKTLTPKFMDFKFRVEFAHRMDILSNDIYKSAVKNYRGDYVNTAKANSLCLNSLQRYEVCTSGIDLKNILAPVCDKTDLKPSCQVMSFPLLPPCALDFVDEQKSEYAKRLENKKAEQLTQSQSGTMDNYVIKITHVSSSNNEDVGGGDNNDEYVDEDGLNNTNVNNEDVDDVNNKDVDDVKLDYNDDDDDVPIEETVVDYDHVEDVDVDINVDIFDPRNWDSLNSDMIKRLVEQRVRKEINLLRRVLKIKVLDGFAAYYTRVLPNNEKCDKEWLVYSKELDKVFCFYCKLLKKDTAKGPSIEEHAILFLEAQDRCEIDSVALLQVAESENDSLIQCQAKSLATNKLGDFEFLVAIVIWFEILYAVNLVNNKLQSNDMLIDIAIKEVKGLISFFEEFREMGLSKAINDAKEIAVEMDIDLVFVQKRMPADVARGHSGDGGDDDRPPPYQVPTGCGGCLGNRGKGTRKPNLGGRRAGRPHTRQETRNLGLKAITDKSGPVPIRFEVNDRETLMPLGDHAAHWANYLGELVKELPLHYPSWRQMSLERKAGVVAKIGTQFDLRPHMESDRWPQIYAGIQQHLQKIYNGKKAALKERYWVPEEDGTYDLERLRRGRPSHISEVNWDAQLAFWNDPKNLARAAQNKQNRAKSKVMETSATREYPSLIHTFFLTHTVGGVFLNPEDKALYDEMLRLQGLGSNTPTGVPYTEDEIMAIVRGGKQRGHIPGVGRVLP
ncbi:probable flavin-containing monooxygenase 1 [Tanacetum coccineum]